MAKRGDKINCFCGRVVEASCIKHHLRLGIAHSAGRYIPEVGELTKEGIDLYAAILLKTALVPCEPDPQIRIDFKALARMS